MLIMIIVIITIIIIIIIIIIHCYVANIAIFAKEKKQNIFKNLSTLRAKWGGIGSPNPPYESAIVERSRPRLKPSFLFHSALLSCPARNFRNRLSRRKKELL